MRVVFFGTPDFAVPCLKALHREFEVVSVVTQPDRPTGRGRRVIAPPVKIVAQNLGLSVVQPEIVKGRRFSERVTALEPDFVITAAFGRLLGKSLVESDKWTSLNVHASLLPRHRGAAPANWAILSGDTETGISITRMTVELDAGPVLHTARTPIEPHETAGELLTRLSEMGATSIVYALKHFSKLEPIAQNDAEVTWARMLAKQDGHIDWNRQALELEWMIRGLHPWPVAFTHLGDKTLKVHAALLLERDGRYGAPGTIVALSRDGIDVACQEGVLRLLEIQAPGRKRLSAAQFLAGVKLTTGMTLSD